MIAQKVDFKKDCNLAIFETGQIKEISKDNSISGTWSYFDELPDNALVAQFLCLERDIGLACPDHLSEDWSRVNKVMDAVKKSLMTAKVDCVSNCIYELIPEHILLDFYGVKNRITRHVIKLHEKTAVYDHLIETSKMLLDIKKRTVNIDVKNLKASLGPTKVNRFYKKLKKTKMVVDYDIFGTKTGRLTCKRGTFPILNLDKDLREFVIPSNDLFLELDINGAELRAMLFLLEKEQPDLDIHDWNQTKVFKGTITREEAKKRVFAWLYNDESKDTALNGEYDRESLKSKYFGGSGITTPYGRTIQCDEYHSINYLLQSFSNDILLEQAYSISKFLNDRESEVCFLMHDSIILDFSKKDVKIVESLVNMFESTTHGKTKANVRIGKNLGDLRDLKWKK